jgi:hypothetical protein
MLLPVIFFLEFSEPVNVCGIESRVDSCLILHWPWPLRIWAIEFDARRSVNGDVGWGLGVFSA